MRFELAGSYSQLEPLLIEFKASTDLDLREFISLGYTNFDVICIGAGGGRGGGITVETGLNNKGGAGGGGGFHRVKGLLSVLPTTVAIVVGATGTLGVNHSQLANLTDGGDGGYSSFNSTTCRASGGKGGSKAHSSSNSVTTDADGGQGGIGNSITAGGGAAGGLAGTPTPSGPGTLGTNGANGGLVGNIGAGGGGGAGGVFTVAESTTVCNPATSGGNGSYIPGDIGVAGMGDQYLYEIPSTQQGPVIAGGGGGAKATPLTKLPTEYGHSGPTTQADYGKAGDPGVVVLLLTAE